MLQLRSITLKI